MRRAVAASVPLVRRACSLVWWRPATGGQASRAPRGVWRACAASAVLLLTACSLVQRRPAGEPAGSITIGLPGIGSLDPADATTPGALTILRTACDSLVGLDPATGDLRPALAQAWTIDPGGRGLTIRLKPDARYHDDSPVAPSRVAEQLSGIAQTGGTSPAARELAGVLGQKGEQQDRGNGGAATVRVTDDGQLRIELPQPFASLPVLLANPALAPVSSSEAEDAGEGPGVPNCAGPYRIERSKDGLKLVRDPAYRTGNAAFEGGGRGHVATIVVRELGSADEAYDALMAGQVDAAPVPESRVAEAEARRAGHARRGTSEITYLAFDPSAAPTSNPAFRRAVSLALDRVALVDAAFGDRRPPATRWLVGAPDRPTPRSCETGAMRVADPGPARQLLAANGMDAVAVKLPLLFDPTRTSLLVAQAIQAQLQENLGITVRPEPLDGPDLGAALAAHPGPKAWIATTPDDYGVPEHVLESLFRTGSPDNASRFSDPRTDELVDRGRRAADAGERDRAYAEAEDRVCELMPDVPLWTGVSHWAFDPKKLAFAGSSPVDPFGGLRLREAKLRIAE